jgi:hypothetical protein
MRYSCLSLLSAGIRGFCYHAQLQIIKIFKKKFYIVNKKLENIFNSILCGKDSISFQRKRRIREQGKCSRKLKL